MTESTRKSLKIGEILRVEIEKVAHGGHFIARYQGAVIFVRHAIPGEIVDVEVTALEKSFVRADVVAVIEPHRSRTTPPCKYAGLCGGCDFQHIEISHQRELKSAVIAEQFSRIAKMEIDIEVEEVSTPLHWRTRYAASTNSHGEAGFKAARSNEVVAISSCPIVLPEIDFPSLPYNRIGTDKRIEVALDSHGNRLISQSHQRQDRRDQRSTPEIIEGNNIQRFDVAGFSYQVSHSSFWQSNVSAPMTLVDAVLKFAQLKGGDHLLDLYGGVGLFAGAALDIVGPGGRIDIVEASASATADAASNFTGRDNVKIHTGDVARGLKKFKRADVVVLDPPRTGAGKSVIDQIASLNARAIIYVACDPAALARDTTYLSEAGYHLENLRAFDLFPMTHHIESIALYTRTKVS